MAFVSASAFICEKVLTEKDEVSSAIRIVEVFFVPPAIENVSRVVAMCLYSSIRLTPDDEEPHSVLFTLVRPNGEKRDLPAVANKVIPPARFPDMNKALMLVGQVAVEVKELGIHHFLVILDGKEVAKTEFIISLQTPGSEKES